MTAAAFNRALGIGAQVVYRERFTHTLSRAIDPGRVWIFWQTPRHKRAHYNRRLVPCSSLRVL